MFQLLFLCKGIILIIFLNLAALASADEISDFRDSYVKNSEKLLEATSQVKGQVRLTTTKRDQAGKIVRKTVDYGSFASSGKFGKLELTADRPIRNNKLQINYVYCLADDLFYTLSKRNNESVYSVESYGNLPKPGAKPSEFKPVDYKIYLGLLLKSSHSYFDMELSRSLNPTIIQDFVAKSIRTEGKNFIKISYKLKGDPKQGREFDVEPDKAYRIVRASSTYSVTKMDSTEIVYNDQNPYFPKIVTQVTPQLEVVCEFQELQFEPTSENDFLPSFYGITDLNKSQSYSPYQILAIVTLIIIIVFGIWRQFSAKPKKVIS